jgi:hypothetical protein
MVEAGSWGRSLIFPAQVAIDPTRPMSAQIYELAREAVVSL